MEKALLHRHTRHTLWPHSSQPIHIHNCSYFCPPKTTKHTGGTVIAHFFYCALNVYRTHMRAPHSLARIWRAANTLWKFTSTRHTRVTKNHLCHVNKTIMCSTATNSSLSLFSSCPQRCSYKIVKFRSFDLTFFHAAEVILRPKASLFESQPRKLAQSTAKDHHDKSDLAKPFRLLTLPIYGRRKQKRCAME